MAAPDRFDVFFVAIGSDNYAQPAGASHFSPLQNAADRSGERVADLLHRAGARFGVSLVSDDTHYVSRTDVMRALNQVHTQFVQSRATHPLLVFYFAGHGISEGIGWNHFSVPGDFASSRDIATLGIEELTAATLHAADLVDTLESYKIPFLLLLDTCSEGKREDFRHSVLSGMAQQNLRDTAAILRVLNEFRNTYPVLFSAEPGTVASTVADPRDPNFYSLGPLARRLTIIFDRANQSHAPFSLSQLLADLSSTTLDATTKAAVCHTENRAFPQLVGDPDNPIVGRLERLSATATKAALCCAAKSVAQSPPSPQHAAGALAIDGKSGEYVTGGRPFRFVSPPSVFLINELSPRRIALEIDDGPGAPWLVSFDAGDGGRFSVRDYPNAQRFDMGNSAHPGIEISGNGHGCNSVAGSFTVTGAEYAASGALSRVKMNFTQLCDDVRIPLTGSLDLTIHK